jgi:uncharacterized protein (DUF2141 family)
MKFLSVLFLVSQMFLNASAQTTEGNQLSVTVKSANSDKGMITVNVFNSEQNFLKKAVKSQSIKAEEGESTFIFNDLPEGTYTVFALHDKNGNGKLDMNVFGIPNEPYGLSKKGKNRFGPPVYEKAVFELKANTEIEVKIN